MEEIFSRLTPTVRTVLIDGRSGSGKTTLSRQLADATDFYLVHMDDFYPGWNGLAAGSQIVARDVLAESNPGFWRWDWQLCRPSEWVSLDPSVPLIVEGVGALTRESLEAAQRRGDVLTVEVRANPRLRKERALRRDPHFAPWLEMWAEQERSHFACYPSADVVTYTNSGLNLG